MGTLAGLKVVEMAGLSPPPFCPMMLADHGACVAWADRRNAADMTANTLLHGCQSVAHAKSSEGREIIRDLIADSPSCVRTLGWVGQDVPLAQAAGRDISYISLASVADMIGQPGGPPIQPLDPVGDYGGDGMSVAYAPMAVVREVASTGKEDVVDCTVVEGALLALSFSETIVDELVRKRVVWESSDQLYSVEKTVPPKKQTGSLQ